MGKMFASTLGNTGAGSALKEYINIAINSIFGTDGFLDSISKSTASLSFDSAKFKSAQEMVGSLSGMMEAMRGLGDMGREMNGGLNTNLGLFANGFGSFMVKMNSMGDLIEPKNIEKVRAMADAIIGLRGQFGSNVALDVKGSASVAVNNHDEYMLAYYTRAEGLLTRIANAVERAPVTSSAINQTKGNVPAWRPESLFSEESDTF